jgi:hypothetical protein
MPVEGCHILEVRTYTALDEAGKAAKCEALGITGMNDLRNLITLCKGCHLEFDKNEICIHPLNLTWIVGSSARPKPTYVPGKAFSGIHSTLIDFTDQANAPKMVLLEERMSRFLKRHAGELYCHLCPFVTTKGPAEFEAHLPHCTGQNKQPRTIYGDADEDLARLADSNLGIAADDNSGAKVGESVAT